MVKKTIALISIVLMMLLVERTVCFTAVDATWGKRSEKVCVQLCFSIIPLFCVKLGGCENPLKKINN